MFIMKLQRFYDISWLVHLSIQSPWTVPQQGLAPSVRKGVAGGVPRQYHFFKV